MSAKPWIAWYIGDWRAKTSRLSLAEKGAYRELIDEYYSMAEALPEALPQLCRICGAITEDEKRAVESVVSQYFTLKNNKLHHKRIDKELTRRDEIQHSLSERGKAGASARWDSQSNATATNSAMLGAMAYPQPQSQPQESRVSLDSTTDAPLVEKSTHKPGNGEDKPKITKAGMWAVELRTLNVKTTSMHPTMLKLIDDGYELPAVIEALQIARQRKPFPELIGIGYLDPIIRKPPQAAQASWWASEPATLAKAAECGITPRPGEDWNELRDRIRTHAKAQ